MQNSWAAEPENQFCPQTRNKTNNPILTCRYRSSIHADIHTTWPTTTYSYKDTSKQLCFFKNFERMILGCSREIKEKKNIKQTKTNLSVEWHEEKQKNKCLLTLIFKQK